MVSLGSTEQKRATIVSSFDAETWIWQTRYGGKGDPWHLGDLCRTLYDVPAVTGMTTFGTYAAHQDSAFFLRDVHEGSGIYTVARLAMKAKAMRDRKDEGGV